VVDPDVRFSLANERTLLAYQRTGVGLLAAAVAVAHFLTGALAVVIAGAFSVTAVVAVVGGYVNYRRTDRAIEAGRRMPRSPVVHVLTLALLVCVAVVAVYLATA